MAAGEYGELLLGRADTPLQDGEEPLSVSSQELVQVLETVLSRPTIKPVGREYALTALMKLSTRLPDHSQYIQVTACRHRMHSVAEIAAPCCSGLRPSDGANLCTHVYLEVAFAPVLTSTVLPSSCSRCPF